MRRPGPEASISLPSTGSKAKPPPPSHPILALLILAWFSTIISFTNAHSRHGCGVGLLTTQDPIPVPQVYPVSSQSGVRRLTNNFTTIEEADALGLTAAIRIQERIASVRFLARDPWITMLSLQVDVGAVTSGLDTEQCTSAGTASESGL